MENMIKTVFCQEDANDLEKLGFKLFSTDVWTEYNYFEGMANAEQDLMAYTMISDIKESEFSVIDEMNIKSNEYGYLDELPQVGRVAKDKAFSVFVVQVES